MEISTKYDFKILEKLNSEGVNASLYIIEDLQLGTKLILKKLDKNKIKDVDKYFDESRKVHRLNHSNIVSINSVSYDEKYIYITMPYYKNGSLQQLIEKRNLSMREVVKYSLDFMSAIYHVHSQSIVHCDIKPSNILLDDNDNAILTDFGSSLYLNNFGNAKLKNVYYKHIAPEQCNTSTISKKLDIYQIGTTLYRMCNGDEEYNRQAKRYKDLNSLKIACASGKFPVRKKYMPHIPKEIINIIEKCININPFDRYTNVLEVMNDIASINTNLDWYYKKENEDKYVWVLNNNKVYTRIVLYKDEGFWKVLNDENDMFIIDTKAKGYRIVRELIKKHENKINNKK